MTEKATITIIGEPAAGRRCGACQLCCTVMPVPPVGKLRGQRCQYQRFGKGCMIYEKRPRSCADWSCSWLIDATLVPGRLRPDHCGVVFDPAPDYITTVDNETGERTEWPVFQLWVDPKRPEAHRDPGVRAVIAEIGTRYGMLALARIGDGALVICPPSMSADGEWHEQVSNTSRDETEYGEGRMARALQLMGPGA